MTERQRILAVYRGETPDQVPLMLDLSHYYYHRFQKDWDLCRGYAQPESDMIQFNKQMKAGFYMPNQSIFFRAHTAPDVTSTVRRIRTHGPDEIAWRCDTPLGSIERVRVWNAPSYSWAIRRWGVETEQDLEVLGRALSTQTFEPVWDSYRAWEAEAGEDGVVYIIAGYSAMGQLLNYWMGVENTIYAAMDWPDTLHAVVDAINENNLNLIRLLAQSPAPVICMGDNFSSDVQSPAFFAEWSADYYGRAIDILHAAGKKVAVHVDGKLRNAIAMIRDVGADAIDAVTPGSVGAYTPQQCRDEAGDKLILSGGIPNELWLPEFPMAHFERAVLDWLDLRERSSALISAAGDQVPPGAEERRIHRMRELVDQYGRY
ncbi:MAG: hypothetical protein HFF17_08400 [Oscillospiraceae bacterium]|nr:hypothetical protein [Oscillospiraceae bacterium]